LKGEEKRRRKVEEGKEEEEFGIKAREAFIIHDSVAEVEIRYRIRPAKAQRNLRLSFPLRPTLRESREVGGDTERKEMKAGPVKFKFGSDRQDKRPPAVDLVQHGMGAQTDNWVAGKFTRVCRRHNLFIIY
jgi:hypothetical protein